MNTTNDIATLVNMLADLKTQRKAIQAKEKKLITLVKKHMTETGQKNITTDRAQANLFNEDRLTWNIEALCEDLGTDPESLKIDYRYPKAITKLTVTSR